MRLSLMKFNRYYTGQCFEIKHLHDTFNMSKIKAVLIINSTRIKIVFVLLNFLHHTYIETLGES